jgi:hypothetical protein
MQFLDLRELQRFLGVQCQKLQLMNLRCSALINGAGNDFTAEEVAKAFEELKAAFKESVLFSTSVYERLPKFIDGLVTTSWIGETAKMKCAFNKLDAVLNESRRLIKDYEAKAKK